MGGKRRLPPLGKCVTNSRLSPLPLSPLLIDKKELSEGTASLPRVPTTKGGTHGEGQASGWTATPAGRSANRFRIREDDQPSKREQWVFVGLRVGTFETADIIIALRSSDTLHDRIV